MNDDLRELLNSLKSHGVDFLVIGAHAVAFHGHPRLTGDVDLWIDPAEPNSLRLAAALSEFGADIGDRGAETFARQDRQMIRLGVPPHMVDILNFAGSSAFKDVYGRSMVGLLDDVSVRFPSVEDLIDMKRSSGRTQDLADIERLRGSGSES